MKVFYYADIILMFVVAYFCYNWGGIWVAEGILAGLGFFAATKIQGKKEERG